MRQPSCSSSWTQRTPAGLPFGMPGMADVIDGAVQQAPQPGRHRTGADGEFTETGEKSCGVDTGYVQADSILPLGRAVVERHISLHWAYRKINDLRFPATHKFAPDDT
jgi:hypothetical protein